MQMENLHRLDCKASLWEITLFLVDDLYEFICLPAVLMFESEIWLGRWDGKCHFGNGGDVFLLFCVS